MENLPDTVKNVVSVITDQSDPDTLLKIQKFTKYLNKSVDKKKLQKYNGAEYLPISFMEMMLDELFFGQWSIYNFHWEKILNEIVGSITLEVIHPITGNKIIRDGAAAIQIMVHKCPENEDRSKWALNPENKKSNSLLMGFPKLKAECLKNACLSLGKAFGRDVNRKFEDQYDEIIKDNPEQKNTELDEIRDKILEALDHYQGEDKTEIQNMCATKQANGEFTIDFAKNIASQINLKI